MYLECVEGTIDESHFIGASLSAIEVVYDSDCDSPGTLRIEDSTFDGNGDSAIEVYDERLEQLQVVRSVFLNNDADNSGGAVYADEVGQILISDSRFTNNSADDYGGAVYVEDAVDGVSIINSTFVSNEAFDDEGGAVAVEYSGPVTIRGSSFRDNATDEEGGAVYLYEVNATISASIFTSNYSEDHGGAVFAASGNLTIENSRLEFNESDNHGGAVYFDGDDSHVLTITRSALNGNVANIDDGSTGAGGAIFAEDVTRVDISGNVITANRARWGGAIHLEIEDTPKQRDLVLVSGIRSNTLKGNSTFNSSVSQFNGGRVLSVVHETNDAGVCTAVTSGPRVEKQLSKSRNKLTGVRAGHGVSALCSSDPKWESD
jgi:predicted outer membrane repeat protein